MLSTPSSSARRHASRSSVIVHCCGWMVAPTLNRLGSRAVAPWAFCMITDLIPQAIDMRSAGEDFWQRYHEFRRARHSEARPEDPIAPDEVERRRLVDSLRYEINDSYEVVSGGRMVAFLRTAVTRPGVPGYEDNRQFLWCYGAVLEPYRRQGLGRRLLPLVLDVMDRHGCTYVTFESDEDSGHAFIKWLGAPQKAQGAENRLRIADVDWAMVDRWIEDGEKRNPQTKL